MLFMMCLINVMVSLIMLC